MSTSPPTSPSDDNVFHYHSCSSEGATYSSRAALPQRKLFSNSVIGGGSYGSIHASASFSSPSFTTSPSNSSPTNNSRQRRFYSNSELSPKATTLDTNPLHLNNNNQSIASTLPKDMDHSPKTEKIRQSSKLYKEEEINSHSSSVQCFSCLHVKPGHSRPGKLYITQSHLIFLYKDILNLDRMESPPPPSSLIDYPNLVKSQNQPQYPFQFDSTRDKQNQKQKKETEKKSIPHSGRFGKHCMDRHAKRDFDHDHDSPFNPIINNDFDDDSDSSSHSLDSSISLSISLENIGQFDDDDSHDLGENDSFLFKQIEQEAKNKLQELDDEGDYPNHYHDTPSTPVRKYIRSVEKKAEQYLNKLDLSDHDLERYIDSELSPRSEDSRQNEYEHEQMYTIEDSLYDVNGFQWVLSDLAEIYPRHYHMKDIALELFGHDQNQKHYKTTQKNKPKLNIGPLSNTSLYLAFCNDQYDDNIDSENAMSGRNNFLSLLQKQTIPNLTFQYGWYKKSKNKNKHSLYYLTLAWKHSQISNYDYLIRLNAMSGRSKHDVGQYPVLPWVLSNYTSQTLPNLSDTRNFRDLKKPMGAQDESRRVKFLEKYRSLCEGKDSEPCSDPPFMYGSHYSSPGGVVLHYLVRLRPFAGLHKQLQVREFQLHYNHMLLILIHTHIIELCLLSNRVVNSM